MTTIWEKFQPCDYIHFHTAPGRPCTAHRGLKFPHGIQWYSHLSISNCSAQQPEQIQSKEVQRLQTDLQLRFTFIPYIQSRTVYDICKDFEMAFLLHAASHFHYHFPLPLDTSVFCRVQMCSIHICMEQYHFPIFCTNVHCVNIFFHLNVNSEDVGVNHTTRGLCKCWVLIKSHKCDALREVQPLNPSVILGLLYQ